MTRMRILLAALFTVALGAVAQADGHGGIHATAPWSRATGKLAHSAVVYVTLENTGNASDRLVAASTPVAGRAELHTHIHDGNVMRMREVKSIEVGPHAKVRLQPGGLHVMLMGLTQPLVEGRSFPLTLNFEHAGSVEVQVTVGVPEGAEQSNMKHDMKMGEKKKQGG